ncbi:MAG: metallophosphoesterase family protein [Pseudomonadota bacterium]
MELGLISDTHGLLRPEALAALRGSALILHAGDIGAPELLRELEAFAPVVAVRGNNDAAAWAAQLPERTIVDAGGLRLLLLHDRARLEPEAAAGVHAIISGHSHRPSIEERHGVLFINPGSAGPRRFRLPVALARARIRAGRIEARIVNLS